MLKLVGQHLRHQVRQLSRVGIQRSKSAATASSESTLDSSTPIPVTKALQGWPEKLREAGVGDVDFNLKCLVAHVLGRKFNVLPSYNGVQFNADQLKEFERLCEARCARMPLQYILGEWDFMDLTLKTAPTVFIPRPETEEFVVKVVEKYRVVKDPVNMLEIGCGSGAMSLAILHALPHVRSTAIECSKVATELARENARLLKMDDRFTVHHHTMEADKYLPAALSAEKYDLLIANPPYVKTEEFPMLNPEVVAYENLKALDGGPDGLRIARLVFDAACQHLRSGGQMWLELGADHPPLVKTIINLQYEGRLRYIASYKDQYKRERFVEIEKV